VNDVWIGQATGNNSLYNLEHNLETLALGKTEEESVGKHFNRHHLRKINKRINYDLDSYKNKIK
jgi:hypothetical protein